ncbi:breast cancer type 2 susceptibility protein isoform X2 [Hyperolius riggenbachi]|uniref:breast cancer type 2 susceptibility protein isoform X2 n=1 Tax=Hyperolius riggenbachi TaxID=752182 RepID=UPI0035A3759B
MHRRSHPSLRILWRGQRQPEAQQKPLALDRETSKDWKKQMKFSFADLGPISVNWFEELSAEAVRAQPSLGEDEEKKVGGQDDFVFKTPKCKQPNYSQLDSTPSIFREQSLCSPLFLPPNVEVCRNQPGSEHYRSINKPERSPGDTTPTPRNEVFGSLYLHDSPDIIKEMFKTPPWAKRSTVWSPQRDGEKDFCDSLFCTPKLVRSTKAKYIMESLGAETDPEMSWSSSLATPPSPTVIIAQGNDEPSRIKTFDNKDAVIVRSLFSELRKDVETNPTTAPPSDVDLETDRCVKATESLGDPSHPEPSKIDSDTVPSNSVKMQPLLDAVKDEEAFRMAENVHEGMDDILSIFFTSNKPLALRKVKVDSRAKRRNRVESSVVLESTDGQSAFIPSENDLGIRNQSKDENSELGRNPALNQDTSSIPSSYQWSPLTLPELNVTQLDGQVSTGTDYAIFASERERDPIMSNDSPHRDPGKCSAPDAGGPALNQDTSSIPSSYQWSPLTLRELNATQLDDQVPTGTDNGIFASEREMDPLMSNYSPHQDPGKCSPPHGPPRIQEVAKTHVLDRDSSDTLHPQNAEVMSTVGLSHNTTNTTYTEQITSEDRGWRLVKQSVLPEMNEKMPQTSNRSTKSILSTLKRPSKFLYYLNDMKNGPARDLISDANKIPEINDAKTEGNQETSNSLKAVYKPVQADEQLAAKEGPGCLKTNNVDLQETKECSLSMDLADSELPASGEIFCLEAAAPTIATTTKTESHIQRKATTKAGDLVRRSLQESSMCFRKEVPKGNPVETSEPTSTETKQPILDMSNQRELLENHKISASICSEQSNTCIDILPVCRDFKASTKSLDAPLCNANLQSFGGFKTASDKQIHISEDNLKKAELLFRDEDQAPLVFQPMPRPGDVTSYLKDPDDSASTFRGFRTAAHKEIIVTESKITKGRLLFKDLEEGGENIGGKDTSFVPTTFAKPKVKLMPCKEKVSRGIDENVLGTLRKDSSEETKEQNQNVDVVISNAQSFIDTRSTMKHDQSNLSFSCHTNCRNDEISHKKMPMLFIEKQPRVCEMLTESQKAEVIELSSILENVDSQFDFTQLRKTSVVTLDKENLQTTEYGIGESQNLNNSDVWKDVDFNDSFAAGADSVENVKSESDQNTTGATTGDSGVVLISANTSKECKNHFGGFSLASGKSINISDEDMIKAIERFGDLEDVTFPVKCSSNNLDKWSLQTNSSSIPVLQNPKYCSTNQNNGKEPHSKGPEMEEPSLKFEENASISECSNKKGNRVSNTENVTLKTSLITEDASTASEVGFSKADCEQNFNVSSSGSLSFTSRPAVFLTAKGKVINVNTSLAKAKNLFNDILDPKDIAIRSGQPSLPTEDTTKMLNPSEDRKVMPGLTVEQSVVEFSTAVDVHDSLLKQSPMSEIISGKVKAENVDMTKKNIPAANMVKFSTAGGKPVQLSDESLKKAQQMFSDIDNQQLETVCENVVGLPKEMKTNIGSLNYNVKKVQSVCLQETEPFTDVPPLGFSTASGKSVAISHDCLQKARMVFSEVDGFQDFQSKPVKDEEGSKPAKTNKGKRDCGVAVFSVEHAQGTTNLPPLGFSTASGKTVAVSSDSLQKARLLFADTDSSNVEHEFHSTPATSGIGSLKIGMDQGFSGMLLQSNVQQPQPCLGETNTHSFSIPAKANVKPLLQENTPTPTTSLFSTAGGKPVHVAEEALKAQEMFAELDKGNTKLNIQSGGNMENISSPALPIMTKLDLTLPPPGFSTASGKAVAISHDALQKAKLLFSCTDDVQYPDGVVEHKNRAGVEEHLHTSEPDACQSACTENVTFMPSINQEIDNCLFSEGKASGSMCKVQVGNTFKPGMSFFSTAGGKAVTLSDKALKKAREMFAELDEGDPKLNIQGGSSMENIPSPALPPPGFSTASGKTVAVSHDALQKAKLLFSSTDDVQYPDRVAECKSRVGVEEHLHMESSMKQETGNRTFSEGKTAGSVSKPEIPFFSTAGGKAVTLSDDALKKAREVFAELDEGDAKLNVQGRSSMENITSPARPAMTKLDLTFPPPGFSTASGKTVAVSHDALQKAKLLFSSTDDVQYPDRVAECKSIGGVEEHLHLLESSKKQETGYRPFSEDKTAGSMSKPGMPSFSTAGGKAVTLSEDALKKAREMFSEIDKCSLHEERPEDILDNALSSVPRENVVPKKAIGPATSNTERHCVPTVTTNSSGFSMASGKNVTVSEAALQKVKGLFEESADAGPVEDHQKWNSPYNPKVNKNGTTHNPSAMKQTAVSNNKYNNLQDNHTRSVESNTSDNVSFESSCAAQHPMLRHSTPFHNAGVSGKMQSAPFITSSQTPENYIEIEAVESAKAFMEDEDLTDADIRTDEMVSKPSNLRNGKRQRPDDRACHGEPPIKRQLLPEFDRSLQNESKLTLMPVTSSPSSTLKDRRKFLYDISLKPSTCDPASFSAGKNAASISHLAAPRLFPSGKQSLPADVSSDPRSHPDREPMSRSVSPFQVTVPLPSEGCAPSRTDPQLGNHKLQDKPCAQAALPECGMKSNESDFSQLVPSLRCARDMQEMRIRKKQRQRIKPHPGSLYQLKASSAARVPLVEAVQGMRPTVYTKTQLYRLGVVKNHIGMNSESARTFDFHCLDYFTRESFLPEGGVQIADGGWLVPSDKLTAGREELYRALCDTPGVDPKLISPDWVYNHYRWIVWKLAAMEVMFPEVFASRCLTPERVLLQLKYRYDVEVDKSQRSALRKIMERDDTATKTLVLCVSKIISWAGSDKNESGDAKQAFSVIEVSDGWYGIKALLDAALTTLLHRGRLFIGQKIIVHGAELVGSENACTPLEAPESLMLKLSANSTRPALWYTRLGYYCDPRPFSLPLSSLFAEGGVVGCVDVVIQRIYPIQWMEKMANGTYMFRNDRAEEREAERHSAKQQKHLESLFHKIQKDFEQQEACEKKFKGGKRHSLSISEITSLQDAAEIYEALQNEPDPGYIESCLSSEQLRALNHHRQALNDKKQAEIQAEFRKAMESADSGSGGCTRREVTPVWKMRIVGYKEQDPLSGYTLNIWRPLPDVVSLLKEGSRFKMYHLSASQSKSKADTAAVQLSATKKTQFQQLQPSQDILDQIYTARQVTEFSQLLQADLAVQYGEVDLVGMVIATHQKLGAPPVVYLSDETHNLVAVKFWADLSQLALEELTKPCTFIAASNLRWRSEYTATVPIVTSGDLSYVAANPKEHHLQKAIHKLRQSVQHVQRFHHEAELKLQNTLKVLYPEARRSLAPHTLDPHTMGPPRNTFSTPMAKTGRHLVSPVSTPSNNHLNISSSSEMDPKTCKKMKGLDFLSRIPSPQPLTPVQALVSPSLHRAFRPPRSMQSNVQSSEQPLLKSKGGFVADEELAMINTQALVSEEGQRTIQPIGAEPSDQLQKTEIPPSHAERSAAPSHSVSLTGEDTDARKTEDAQLSYQGKLRKRRRQRL